MLTENKLSSGRKTFDRSKWTSLDLEVGENRETSYYEYVGVTVDQDKPEKEFVILEDSAEKSVEKLHVEKKNCFTDIKLNPVST